MELNQKKLKELTGIKYTNNNDLIYYIISILNYLESHNKNYTNTQYHKIQLLKDIFNCFE